MIEWYLSGRGRETTRLDYGREHCEYHSPSLICSLSRGSRERIASGALGSCLCFLFFRVVSVKSEYVNDADVR